MREGPRSPPANYPAKTFCLPGMAIQSLAGLRAYAAGDGWRSPLRSTHIKLHLTLDYPGVFVTQRAAFIEKFHLLE